MKRIVLFAAANVAVLAVIYVVLNVLGVDQALARGGTQLDLRALLVFSAIFGFTGSFISLALSKWMAKMATRAHVIESPRNAAESWLKNTVHRLADQSGIGRPEVAIYDSPDVNAFATGASRNHALVAVSTGLLSRLSEREVEAVLGHEVSHVANGDMVTMTLLQGVLNTFVIFFSRVIGFVVRIAHHEIPVDDDEIGTLARHPRDDLAPVVEVMLAVRAEMRIGDLDQP